jgi:UDP-N-acetylglucosamine 2-epimerase (hydrolysing)
MAAALVCATNYIRSAHIEGGEVSGTIDEAFRHCNTKLATAHLVSSENAAKRILGMGETPESVFVIGSPELDLHNAESGVDIAEVRARYEIPFDEYGVAIFHSVTSEQDSIQAQASALFDTLKASGRAFVVIQPNNDPGSNLILDVIRTLPADRFRVLPSMRFTHFSELLKNAALIIGNSSVGVREAPFLGIPSIDVGTRQTNRSRAPSISSLDAHDTQSLSHLINRHWGVRFAPDTGFGHGRSVDKFLSVIEGDSFWNLPLQKNFSE